MGKVIKENGIVPNSMAQTLTTNINGPGYIYKILPLKTTLQKKQINDTPSITKKTFKPGDYVKGKSIDNKWYRGKISRICIKGDNIKVAYIQNDKDNTIIPVIYKTLKYVDNSVYQYNSSDNITEDINLIKINNIIKNNYSMNSFVHQLILEYFDDQNTQLKNLLKNCDKEQRKYTKQAGPRRDFLINILGKNTYKKYASGEFAPIPLSALSLTINDFAKFSKDTKKNPDDERVKKLISLFGQYYHSNDVNLVNNGITLALQTNIVFQKLDDIIDFFNNIFSAYKKVYKNEDIDWNILVKKFRNYLK